MVTTRHHPEEFAPPSSSPSKQEDANDKSGSMRKWEHVPSNFFLAWLFISSISVIWDAFYCILRPHSMPGGKWHLPWTPYALYGTIDYMYGWPAFNAGNGFTSGQSVMNLVETAIYVWYMAVVYKHGQTAEVKGRGRPKATKKSVGWFFTERKVVDGRMGAFALVWVFSSFVMTTSKTVLYWLCEFFAGFDNIGHNDPMTLFFLWIIPNGLWIVIPGIASYQLGGELIQALEIANRSSGGSRPKAS